MCVLPEPSVASTVIVLLPELNVSALLQFAVLLPDAVAPLAS